MTTLELGLVHTSIQYRFLLLMEAHSFQMMALSNVLSRFKVKAGKTRSIRAEGSTRQCVCPNDWFSNVTVITLIVHKIPLELPHARSFKGH